jgi:integrase
MVRAGELRLTIVTFSDAADRFIEWAEGEYRTKPNTWKRLHGSLTSAKLFFAKEPLHVIAASTGRIQDYMGWRRKMDIKEVSLRHDMHALSPLFKYGISHNWCKQNPVTSANLKQHGTKMPSDADAVRIHVLTAAEEIKYFEACLRPPERITGKAKAQTQIRHGKRVKLAAYEYTKLVDRDYRDLHDIGRLMTLRGPRPEEVRRSRVEDVNLEHGTWYIPKSKSNAGERTLRLTAEARSILAARIAIASKSGWLFEGKKKGTHLKDVENAHQAVLEATGLAFVLYDCRHSSATRFYEATKDVFCAEGSARACRPEDHEKNVHISQKHVHAAMEVYEAAPGRCRFGVNASAENDQSGQTSTNTLIAGTDRIQ